MCHSQNAARARALPSSDAISTKHLFKEIDRPEFRVHKLQEKSSFLFVDANSCYITIFFAAASVRVELCSISTKRKTMERMECKKCGKEMTLSTVASHQKGHCSVVS